MTIISHGELKYLFFNSFKLILTPEKGFFYTKKNT